MAIPNIVRERTPQLIVLIAILALNATISPGFFSIEIQNDRLYGSLIDVLNRGAPVALLSIGMTLVIATGGIDLSVGAVMAIVGAVAASLITSGYSLPVTLIGALSVGLVCGIWNGLLVSVLRIQPIIATLILMVAGRGIAQLITKGVILTFNDKPELIFIGSGSFMGLPMPVIIWVAVAALTIFCIRRSALGMFIEAIGVNRRASTLSGVHSGAILLTVYAVSSLCSSVAGIIVAADIKGADANNAGLSLEMDAILSVVIGGTSMLGGRFSILSSLIGAMIIQSLNTGILMAGFPPEFNLIIKAAIILIILIIQSPASQASMATFKANRRAAAIKTESREHAAR